MGRMAEMSERQFQDQLLQLARFGGWLAYHTFDSRRSQPGFPDLVLVRAPRLIFAELKTETGRVTPEQQAWLDALESCAVAPHPYPSKAVPEVYVWRPRDLPYIDRLLLERR